MENFFIITITYLGAAIVMVPIVRKLGFSSVIGYILGGIAIGPFALGITGNPNDVMNATEFGVVMLLFIVGLGMEPKRFWEMRKVIVGLGVTQVVLTTFFLFLIFYWADWETNVAITVALCFSMSSTAIVLQTLKEKNLIDSVAGESSFSILLLQDMAVIPILAFLPWLAGGEIGGEKESSVLITMLPNWIQPFSILLGVVILIFLGRYVFVPFLRFVSAAGMSELLTATSLFLVVGVSQLMIEVGLSPALGAFLAGVMLANSEFRHELESNIDPFKGLLLAVFFVSVGSTINFNVILEDPLFIFTTVAVVLAVKFVILFGIGKVFRMSNENNILMSFGLAQVGEFAFVLITYATGIHLLNDKLNSQMMAVVAITMLITPFLLMLSDGIINHYINPKEKRKGKEEKDESTKISGNSRVIIVGYGYFGSTVGRLLKINGYNPTILDHDADRVKLLRENGVTVYYGNATRKEILQSAGAEKAEILVVCLSSYEDNYKVIQVAREYFPHLQIFARAKNRLDAYDFLNHGVDNIYRETLGTAVDMGVDILHATGMRKYQARRMANRFETIDKLSTRRLAKERLNKKPSFTIQELIEVERELLRDDKDIFNDDNWTKKDKKVED